VPTDEKASAIAWSSLKVRRASHTVPRSLIGAAAQQSNSTIYIKPTPSICPSQSTCQNRDQIVYRWAACAIILRMQTAPTSHAYQMEVRTMLILWRGWGIVVPFLFFGIPALGQWSVDTLLGQGTYLRSSSILFAVFCLVSATIVWFLGRRLNQRDTPNATSNFHVAHSFILLRMEYWAFIFILGAVAAVVF
jgi:hypothetical protein